MSNRVQALTREQYDEIRQMGLKAIRPGEWCALVKIPGPITVRTALNFDEITPSFNAGRTFKVWHDGAVEEVTLT